MERAVFLDKDGTLIHNVPHNVDLCKIVLYEDAVPFLKEVQRLGYRIFVVTNQSGVAQGKFSEDAVVRVGAFLRSVLSQYSIKLESYYYCPHDPGGILKQYALDCDCKKPREGMLKRAAREWNIDLKKSWMIGDILHDVEAGNRAGCRSILINNGNETEWKKGEYRDPMYIAGSLKEAAEIIKSKTSPVKKVRKNGGGDEREIKKSGRRVSKV